LNDFSKSLLVVTLIVTVVSVGSADVRAQSRENTQKRLFAERLSRLAIESARSAADARAAERKKKAHKPVRSAVDVSVAVSRANGPNLGVPAATPVVPPGREPSRDAFIETLYTQILGFDASESDLHHWTRALERGEDRERIAIALWDSKEHRLLVRRHESPGIRFRKAYLDALEAARRAKHAL
jgi:Domain of unknown function (DUF4214)